MKTMLAYRYLTGKDDDAFCHKVTEALANGLTKLIKASRKYERVASKLDPIQLPFIAGPKMRVGEPYIREEDIPVFEAAWERGGKAALIEAVPDSYVEGMTASGTPDEVLARVQKFRDALAEPMFAGLTDAQAKALEAQLKTATLHRWEVDTLLDGPAKCDGRTLTGPVTRSIDKCNRLIQELLRERKAADGLPEEEVHWVVVSGNASRYPLIRERMTQQLQVEDLGERLTLDEANLKHAVAKGAADAAVLLRPVTVGQIAAVADAKERMPEKTSFFQPKPLTGLVFRSLDL